VRVGIEATGHARWFERLLAELKFELWIGNAAEIKRPGYASRRPTARMLCCCSGCWWKIAFRASGFRARRTVIYAN
jgi:hypothetical protein